MSWILPSSAHAAGAGGAFYTTDVGIANTGLSAATVQLRFLGHDADGTAGPLRTYALPGGKALSLPDVLGTEFGANPGYGAIAVTSTAPDLLVTSHTWTASPSGGTYGQSVPGIGASSFVRTGSARALVGLTEDSFFRTNLVLANATAAPLTVHVELVSESGSTLAAGDLVLPALGMTQVGHVVRTLLGPSGTITGGQLLLSTPTPGGAFAAYASVIDNVTNDPRTLLPE